ncbi:ankyrin, partial [Anaeromyces robustus]
MIACKNGYLEIIKYLFEQGVTVDAYNQNNDKSPLYSAIEYGYWNIVDFFENQKSYVNKHSTLIGDNPLMNKCLSGEYERVQDLIKYGYDVNDIDEYGYTPLMKACIGGKIEIVKFLINQSNANINNTNNSEYTALMFAVENNHFDIVKYLIENHATLNNKSMFGINELMMACKNSNVQIVQYLID